MKRIFASFIASLRYFFVLAVLALVVLALGSLAKGIRELLVFALSGGFGMTPGDGAAIVPYFIRSLFLYFLAVAFCSLFIAEPPVPQWMQVRNLFQFRTKILTFLSFILPLAFLGRIIEPRASSEELLFIGGGVFLVLAGIFLLIRYGSPSGDEGMSREGNRPPDRDSRRDRKYASTKHGEAGKERKWPEKHKENLKFQKEDQVKEAERDSQNGTETRHEGHVTVKPGPKRPRQRR